MKRKSCEDCKYAMKGTECERLAALYKILKTESTTTTRIQAVRAVLEFMYEEEKLADPYEKYAMDKAISALLDVDEEW